MKKIMIPLVLILAAAGTAFSQRTINDPNAEKRGVSGYHAVEVGGGIDLYLSEGEETVVVSAADTRYRDRIRTEVKNGVLKIWYDWKSGFHFETGNKKMKAYVSYKALDRVEGSGGSDVYVDGVLRADKLSLDVSGGADFSGKVDAGDLKVEASGGSDVKISGQAKKLSLEASGGSDFKGYDLTVDFCELKASGGSDIYITVNKEMTADASGGSDIYYKGTGLIREIRSGGSSGIKKVS